jgi:hypothetical protein
MTMAIAKLYGAPGITVSAMIEREETNIAGKSMQNYPRSNQYAV